ncbi:multidrug effflux MFS transporter [Shewanella schlegeliana]|uniref:Bcr/CflA family efflux transporter n=1 Tax=Shewanella schlegeliana TaxID=190308 RepID=A0ABS1SWH7_9GAMM|nr:multidrug effflux MFS transporter [Shewanella schlegeliana]MBL4912896.1 multidrug effflux MFS transporter [Shewanella schlegeliana]MCL1109007.1 multidrug effflux MFS transporter [Shewanella schlegeliana]GIU23364.1 MFS transporter [Shewanella schlegeliana]
MKTRPEIWLITSLMMFPQIVETIYSPVLPDIATAFNVSQQAASQTLSIYFIAFALGVIVWGRLADIIGRKPSMLLGLASYALGSFIAINSPEFEYLLLARSLSAFGAAVGSIVTQTMLRDCFEGPELGKVFSIMGMGIGISPALGLILGGLLASISGHSGVFLALGLLAITLLLLCVWRLPETQSQTVKSSPLRVLAVKMGKDIMIWRNTILVASFNLILFSYYSLAPFMFTQLGLNQKQFGASGIVLAIGVLIGSATNKHLISKGWQGETLISLACITALVGAIGVYLTQSNLLFLLPMMLAVIGFGIAIPNILSQALVNYKDAAGTAGALFGLTYYLILGGGLSLAAFNHNLAQVLLCCALTCVLVSLKKR